MVRPFTISLMAAMPLAGTLIGLQLGRSAIAEINPIYFRAAETRFHSDLVANRPVAWTDSPSSALSDASLIQGLGSGCIKCIDYPEEYRPIHDPSVDAWIEMPAQSAEPVLLEQAAIAEEAAEEPEPPKTDVARYAYYVITEEGEQRAMTEESGQSSAPPMTSEGESGDSGHG